VDFGKFFTYMYLLPEGNVGYLKQPIPPHPPQTPQFHMPQGELNFKAVCETIILIISKAKL